MLVTLRRPSERPSEEGTVPRDGHARGDGPVERVDHPRTAVSGDLGIIPSRPRANRIIDFGVIEVEPEDEERDIFLQQENHRPARLVAAVGPHGQWVLDEQFLARLVEGFSTGHGPAPP